MRRALFILFVLLLPTMSAAAKDTLPTAPEAVAERASVGEPGPQLRGDDQASLTAFVNEAIQDTNVMWSTLFEASGRTYVPATWVLVGEGEYARSNCGINAGNPAEYDILNPAFYCIYGGELGRQKIVSSVMYDSQVTYEPVIYLSLPWLESYFTSHVLNVGVAIAYIVAHEAAHHVEYQLGYMDHTGGGCCGIPDEQLELFTDCLAGVWAYSAYDEGMLDEGDINEAQLAAWGPGSDQSDEFGRAPEHGTQAQRLESFLRGYESGSPATCAAAVVMN